MTRTPFCLDDLAAECQVITAPHQLDDRPVGLAIRVPAELWARHPYNASAYAFLQQLRGDIFEYGIIEFPGLPLNRTNYTLAQRAPWEHAYSDNPYLTDRCQSPHQDTPPYPTAFWLGGPRRFSATWVMSRDGLAQFDAYRRAHPGADIISAHRALVEPSLARGSGLLLNRSPGLLLIDNSAHSGLYHARTCVVDGPAAGHPRGVATPGVETPGVETPGVETPMYAFNEVGLLHYLDALDSRRGTAHRDADDEADVREFLAQERLHGC